MQLLKRKQEVSQSGENVCRNATHYLRRHFGLDEDL